MSESVRSRRLSGLPAWLTLVTSLFSFFVLVPLSAALLSLSVATQIGERASKSPILVACVFAAPQLLYTLLGSTLLRSAQRLPRGYPGRARMMGLGMAASVNGIAGMITHWVMAHLFASLPKLLAVDPMDALASLSYTETIALIFGLSVQDFAGLLALGIAISCWWLVRERIRRITFGMVDSALLIGAARWWFLWYQHKGPEATFNGAIRLSLTFLLLVRLGARALPWVLDVVESFNFRSLVAARHLRAQKSGFLAAISFLSILAVSVSSCALTTTLSVMGGFRQDLKRKILGSNAHIVVDRLDERIPNYEPLVAACRTAEGVRGVSPYVSGEVMISSASNLAGAVLRGIDVARIGEVSELPSNMKMGTLDYLAHPEKITGIPTTQIGVGLPRVSHTIDGEVKPKNDAKGITSAIQDALHDADVPPAEPPKPENVLPGIVVGQELARSLRLYLGDEVNVVTPLGELGPTGPMPKSRPFRVAGIFYSGMYEYDMKFAYVTLASAQKFLGTGDRVSGIEITVREPDRAQDVANRVTEALPDKHLRVRPWQELNKNLFGALALEKLAMFIALGIAILVASFCIVGTLTLMVQEKGREVAVLKALGASDRSIVGIFVLEGVLIGTFGSLLGLALGYVVCFAAERFGVYLNPEVYYIDRLPVHIDPVEFVTVGIAAVVVCFLVTIYPAQLASRLRPVDALRYE